MLRDFETIVQLSIQILEIGVSKASVSKVAESNGWPVYDEDATSVTYQVNEDFVAFVTENDPQYYDHFCMMTWVPRPLGSLPPGTISNPWNEVYFSALSALEASMGSPEKQGFWPKTAYDCYENNYRYAIWRVGERILIFQQDDNDPQSGPDVSICIKSWKSEQPLPMERRWRYK